MKKLLSLVLSLVLLVSALALVPVSAADENPAELTWAQFVDGYDTYKSANVKLTADENKIDVSALSASLAEFSGTLDGNGNTLTGLTVTLFEALNGATVKNLTVEGTVAASAGADTYLGGFANVAKGSVTVINCVADIDVTLTMTARKKAYASGFIASSEEAVAFTGCTNKGDVEVTFGTLQPTNAYAGGILGYVGAGTAAFNGCVNTGNITSVQSATAKTNTNVRVGGILGCFGGDGTSLNIVDCVNLGNISSSFNAGGMMAENRSEKATLIENCTNYGNITAGGLASTDSAAYAGGILAHKTAGAVTIKNCANYGTVDSKARIATASANNNRSGGIMGNSMIGSLTISNCINEGAVNTDSIGGGILGRNQSTNNITLEGNFSSTTPTVNADRINSGEGSVGVIVGSSNVSTFDADAVNAAAPATEAAYRKTFAIQVIGTQKTAVSGGKLDIRFVATVSNLNYEKVGFEIVRVVEGKMGKIDLNSDTVYQSLIADGKVFDPESVGGEAGDYFAALAVHGVPADKTVEFIIRPYVIDSYGDRVYGASASVVLNAQ